MDETIDRLYVTLIEYLEKSVNFEDSYPVPELECKIGKGHSLAVGKSIERMLSDRGMTPFNETTVDIFYMNERYTRGSDMRVTKTTKKRLLKEDISDMLDTIWTSQLTLSLEKNESVPITSRDVLDILDIFDVSAVSADRKVFKRVKNRNTYFYSAYSKIDITYVTSTQSSTQSSTESVEIEVELIGDITKEAFKDWMSVSSFVSDMYTMTHVINNYNKWVTLGVEYKGPNYSFLSKAASPDPRNLKKEDFVLGGLIPTDNTGTIYSVTVKGDGQRKNLVIDQSGIWLVRPKRGFPIMTRITPPLVCGPKCTGKHQNCIKGYIGTVLDGELMEPEDIHVPVNPNILHFFPFDCMSYKGSWKVQDLSHLPTSSGEVSRLTLAKAVGDMINDIFSKIIKCRTKKYFVIGTTRDNMARSLKKCEQYLDICNFNTDGYIFTPINYRYKPILSKDSKKVTGKRRTLLLQPDICKLKPWEKLSIDFVVKSSDCRAYVADDSALGELTLFQGSERSPFTINNIISPPFYDRVIEMEPKIMEDNTIKMEFTRVRDDKNANSNYVATEVWKDIQSPIHLASLYGEDFKFMRIYMNKVKEGLLSKVHNANVLDIGSGNGGDLYKFDQRVISMVSVDPNEKNMAEFTRRYQEMNTKMKVTTILTGGEDTDLIVNVTKDVFAPSGDLYIVAMLSLSFFWSSRGMLEGLANTISETVKAWKGTGNAEFLFYTIDGQRVVDLFNVNNTDIIQLGPSTMRLSGNIVDISYPNSIVGEQREYLVVLDDLKILLQDKMGNGNLDMSVQVYPVSSIGKTKGDPILSPDEETMMSLYVTGSIKFNY